MQVHPKFGRDAERYESLRAVSAVMLPFRSGGWRERRFRPQAPLRSLERHERELSPLASRRCVVTRLVWRMSSVNFRGVALVRVTDSTLMITHNFHAFRTIRHAANISATKIGLMRIEYWPLRSPFNASRPVVRRDAQIMRCLRRVGIQLSQSNASRSLPALDGLPVAANSRVLVGKADDTYTISYV